MARKLRTFVTVHERDDKGELTGRSGTFGPDDDLSAPENAWVEKAITNEAVWEGSDADDGVVFSDPGNSGPASVEMTGANGEQSATKDADASAGGKQVGPARSSRGRQ